MGHESSHPLPPSRVAKTTYGQIVGHRIVHDGDNDVDAFQGIPYARPPVGDLRFRKPQPPAPWSDIRPCVKFGPRAIQKDMFFWTKFGKSGPTSEDCLYLNVFTPCWEAPDGGFPIMVFIHGGGFVSDSAVKYGDLRVSRYLVSKGVVVVTAQYRLGYLGYWSTGNEACTDNLGLWDQTAALRWVHDNGGAFNGNVHNVTLFGQSAGGASVDLLSISPHSRYLFHKVIPMAGNGSCGWAMFHNTVEVCREYAAKTLDVEDPGYSDQFIDKLRRVDAQKFGTSLHLDPETNKDLQPEIGPRWDSDFFPRPLDVLRREAVGKPRIIGCCQYEGLIILAKVKATMANLESAIASLYPETVHDFARHRHQKLKQLLADGDDKKHLQKACTEVYSDLFLNLGVQRCVLDWLAAGETAPIWLYSFDYCNPRSWGPIVGTLLPFKGATHCTELSYIFGVGIIHDFEFTAEDIAMLEQTTTLWSNFAKYSNPNGDPRMNHGNIRGVEWNPVTKKNPQRHLSLSLQARMEERFHGGKPMEWLRITSPEIIP